MKKIFLLLFLIPIISKAQPPVPVDSTKLLVGKFSIQARDAESIRYILGTSRIYDDLLYDLNVKYRVRPKNLIPKNQEVVVIDSVSIEAMLGLSNYIRITPHGEVATFYNRLDGNIKGITDATAKGAYLQREVAKIDAGITLRVTAIGTDGRQRYIGTKQ